LFARYRFDSATGLYPVRNRFLHWLLAWLTRDPIGYKAGLSLYGYVGSSPENWMDPFGFQPEFVGPPWSDYYQTLEIETSGETSLTFDQAWKEFRTQCNGAKSKFRNSIWTQGCVGVTQCMLGRPFRQSEWFRNCYSTLGAAMAAKRRVDCAKRGAKNLCGNASQPQVIGFTWEELPETAKKRKVCPGCGFIYWNGAPPSRVPIEGGGVFDVGFYDASLGCFWHANYNEATPDSSVLISKPDKFHPPGSKRSAVYCVICDSDELNSFVED
jgi:RHS repeat-associated protein